MNRDLSALCIEKLVSVLCVGQIARGGGTGKEARSVGGCCENTV